MREAIYQHGSIERWAKDCARRLGWDAEIRNCDVDPLAGRLYQPAAPGRGDLVISHDGHGASFEYELPEDPDNIKATIEQIVKGHQQDANRTAGKHQIATIG
jgi:hypothetical protein